MCTLGSQTSDARLTREQEVLVESLGHPQWTLYIRAAVTQVCDFGQ